MDFLVKIIKTAFLKKKTFTNTHIHGLKRTRPKRSEPFVSNTIIIKSTKILNNTKI